MIYIFSRALCIRYFLKIISHFLPETWGSYFSKEVVVSNLVCMCHSISLRSNVVLLLVFTSLLLMQQNNNGTLILIDIGFFALGETLGVISKLILFLPLGIHIPSSPHLAPLLFLSFITHHCLILCTLE